MRFLATTALAVAGLTMAAAAALLTWLAGELARSAPGELP